VRAVRAAAAIGALALLATACASLPPCPARGGPVWAEWTSPRIVLVTDLDDADARAVLEDLERTRVAVQLAAWRRAPEPRTRLTVIVFRSDSAKRVFLNVRYGAAAIATRSHQAFIVGSGAEHDGVMTQMIVWALSFHYGLAGRVPWFDEGLGLYLASLTVDAAGVVSYGEADLGLLSAVRRRGLARFESLWEPVTLENRTTFAPTSWLAVHYLFNHEPERFLDFQRRLEKAPDARAAWAAAFPDIPPAEMSGRLSEYFHHSGTFSSFRARLPPAPYEAQKTPLQDADVHALRALLYAATPEARSDLARAEIAEAFRLDPVNLPAAYVSREILHDEPTELELPRRLVGAHPESPTAWLLLARARTARHELEEAGEAWEEMRRFGGQPDGPVSVELRVARPD